MMEEQYSCLAECYDLLSSADYRGYSSFIAELFRENGIPDGALVLDLACGTGGITLPLSEMGYDMIGVDLSPEMLDIARKKDRDGKVLWLNQDICDFELYGTVGGIVCCLDSINYLLRTDDIKKCFSLAANYLDPNGLLIFDINSPYKFRNIYGDRHYILEQGNTFLGWRNHFNEKSKLCDFYLTIFSRQRGVITRRDEIQTERMWAPATVRRLIRESGLSLIGEYGGFDRSPVSDTTERIFFVCRKEIK